MSAPATIDPEKIRKELSELWIDLGQAKEAGNEGDGVLRACSLTLIAVVDETDDPSEVGETIAMLMREHPSRAIVVRIRDSVEHYLASQVLAQCWMPFGNRRQICCEQVEIIASTVSLGDLPAVLLPLTVADLPVVLWARSLPGVHALSSIAGKLIVDSERLNGFKDVLELSRTHRAGDLAWVRLTRWRELIAQIFENKCYLAELSQLNTTRITYSGERPTTSAFYLAAWLERPNVIWQRGEKAFISLEDSSGTPHTSLSLESIENVEVNVRGQITHTVFPHSTDYLLLREELSIAGRDPVFETVLPKAALLAENFQ